MKLKEQRRVRGKPGQVARTRAGLAEALEEIRARTNALSRARFEKLVAEAVTYARKRG